MRKLLTPNSQLLTIFLFCITLLSLPSLCPAQDKIAAIVNSEIITQKDLNEFEKFMRMQLSRDYEGEKLEGKIRELRHDLLTKLIEDRLIMQEAKRVLEEAKKKNDPYTTMRLEIPQTRVKAKLTEIKRRYPSEIEFQNDLIRQGLTQADLEDKFKEQFMMYNIVELRVRDRITVRPEEVTSYYKANEKDFVSDEEREIAAITLEKKDVADAVSYGLRTGKTLTDMAALYPLTVNNITAGRRGELRKEIEDVVFKLGLKEVSPPVKIDEQYYIFMLNNVVSPRKLSLKESQDAINELIFSKKMQEELSRWIDELKKQSFIKITQN